MEFLEILNLISSNKVPHSAITLCILLIYIIYMLIKGKGGIFNGRTRFIEQKIDNLKDKIEVVNHNTSDLKEDIKRLYDKQDSYVKEFSEFRGKVEGKIEQFRDHINKQ